jgi:hypothetical protein
MACLAREFVLALLIDKPSRLRGWGQIDLEQFFGFDITAARQPCPSDPEANMLRSCRSRLPARLQGLAKPHNISARPSFRTRSLATVAPPPAARVCHPKAFTCALLIFHRANPQSLRNLQSLATSPHFQMASESPQKPCQTPSQAWGST